MSNGPNDLPRQEHPALRVAAQYGVLDERQNVLFIFVPKNACTVLKATVIMNSPHREAYLEAGMPIHDFIGQIKNYQQIIQALNNPATFRFTVLRDPASRILSAYLNKFVTTPLGEPPGLARNKAHAVKIAQSLAGIQQDPARGITFEEFVHYLAQAPDEEMDPHWIPQTWITGADLSRYGHVGRFENLRPTFDILEQRFGYKPELDASIHLGGQLDHATKYSAGRSLDAPHRATPAELQRLGKIYPPADNFLTRELRGILHERYAEDIKLHNQT